MRKKLTATQYPVSTDSVLETPGSLETKLQEALDDVEQMLAQETQTQRDNTSELVSHLRSAGGKRMRPLLTLLISQLGAPDQPVSTKVKQAAVAVELTHLASLYHDDLMDEATVRRGVRAAHVQWTNTLAVMAGDLIFARASLLVSELGPSIVAQHSQTFERLCLGQMHDIFGPGDDDDPIEFYIDVLRDKTGALIGCAALYGAELSGCEEATVAAVTQFGEDLGVAFQIADDVLDLQATEAQSGKTPGADLRDGTKTLPVLLLEKTVQEGRDTEADRALLKAIGDTASLQDDAVLAQVTAQLAAHPVTAETKRLAEQWVERALGHLDHIPEGKVKAALSDFAHLQINRLK